MQNSLVENYYRLINELAISTHRYLYDSFKLTDRLIGVVGPRGTGKTTLMLQYIKANYPELSQCFYFSADHIFFNQVTLYEFVEQKYLEDGIKVFFIDEIHKYPNWNQELKNLYDAFPKLKIVFSGSSSLELIKGNYDLSRRAIMYELNGLSFREYLNLTLGKNYTAITLEVLLSSHQELAVQFAQLPRLKMHFNHYLQKGYYPFVLENAHSYGQKLLNIIEKTIYEDITNYYNLKTQNSHIFKKILFFVGTSEPGELNIHNLASSLKIDDKTAAYYLEILKETGLIRLLYSDNIGHALLRKPAKIYLDNPALSNIVSSELGKEVNIGAIRELFFLAMTQNSGLKITYAKAKGDFHIGDHFYEIGGKNKNTSKNRIIDLDNYFVVKDDILIGSKREIPLYLFGFLY